MQSNPVIAILLAEAAVMFAIALATGVALRHIRPRAARYWAVAFFCGALSILCMAGWLTLTRPILALLGQIFGFTGVLMLGVALRHLRVVETRPLILLPAIAAYAIAIAIPVLMFRSNMMVFLISHISFAVAAIWVTMEAIALAPKPGRVGRTLILWAMGAFALNYSVRAIGFGIGLLDISFFRDPTWQAAMAGLRIVFVMVSTIGFLTLVMADVHAEEQQALTAAMLAHERESIARSETASLQKLLEERSVFIDVLAHEVRQPLNEASGCLETLTDVLRKRAASPKELINRTQRTSRILDDIVFSLNNTLIAATTLQQGNVLHRRQENLGLLMEMVRLSFDHADRERLSVVLDTTLVEAPIDAVLVSVALRNLVRNALHHGAGKEPVLLKVTQDSPGWITFAVENAARPGITPVESVAFQRQPRAGSRTGHRLGLWIVGQVAALHGGRAEGRIDSWTRFTLSLPLAPPAAVQPAAA